MELKKILSVLILVTLLTGCSTSQTLQSLSPSPSFTVTPVLTPSPTPSPTPEDSNSSYTLTNEGGANGVDFILDFQFSRNIKILQITDTQIMYFEGIRPQRQSAIQNSIFSDGITSLETRVWAYVDEAVSLSKPDIIILTGDNVYGETDDNGVIWKELCYKMDSYKIPWCIVFGNHDNESAIGVNWQIQQLISSEYCIFNRGYVSGNSNYNVLVTQCGKPVFLFYMLDTNGCAVKPNGEGMNPDNVDMQYIYPAYGLSSLQSAWIKQTAARVHACYGFVPSLMFMHIPPIQALYSVNEFYPNASDDISNLGKFTPDRENDSGVSREAYGGFFEPSFWQTAKDIGCKGIFVGHQHKIATSILYDGIRITYGLKTSTFDYHSDKMLGSVKIVLTANSSFWLDYQRTRLEYPNKKAT